MQIPITTQQVEDMLQRVYNQNREALKEYGAQTWRQWLDLFGAQEVGAAVASYSDIYDLYLQHLPEDIHVQDVLEAYISGELPRGMSYRHVVDQGEIGSTGFNPQVPWQSQETQSFTPDQAKAIYQAATQKATGVDKERVMESRKELYFAFNTDADFADKAGVSRTDINKKIRSYSGLSVKDRQLEDGLNGSVPTEHHWVGITNSSFLGQQKVDPDTLDQFVREIDVTGEAGHHYHSDRGEALRRYIANSFLAIDMHVDYKDLGFKIGKFEKKRTLGQYSNETKTITISAMGQHTVSHEIGHYLDWKWAEQLGIKNEPLSRLIHHNGLHNQNIPDPQRQWAIKYKDFIKSLMLQSNVHSEYTQRHSEVFARFIDRFTTWASRGRNVYEESYYQDRFTEQDFRNFVKLLQEKSFVDTAHPLQTKEASNNGFTIEASGSLIYEHETHLVPDIDRYTSDDYAVNVSMQESVYRISIGLYVTNYKLGIAGYQQYWHFEKNEESRAKEVYGHVNDIVQEVIDEIKEYEIPHPLLKPFLRNRLDGIDMEHKERSGVYNYNYFTTEVAKEEDWRATLYGSRYPKKNVEPMNINWHPDETSKDIEVGGNSSRDMTYRYHYKNTRFAESTVNKAELQKIDNIDLPGDTVTIRVDEDQLFGLVGKNVPIGLFEIKTNDGWQPMSSFETVKTAGKNRVLPWALVGLMGLGTGYELGRRNSPKTNPTPPQIEQVQTPAAAPAASPAPEQVEQISEPEQSPVQEEQATAPERENRARGDRNNNPGNIERSDTNWNGMSADQSADKRFIIFDYPQDGIRAMTRVLRNYQRRHNLHTINQIIGRWAPSVENDTSAYAQDVSEQSGFNVDERLNLDDNDVMLGIMTAMIKHENGYQPYDSNTIMQGVQSEQGGGRPWVDANETSKPMPKVLNQPTNRPKHPPKSTIRTFDTKQVELFDKGAARFTYSFEQIDKIKAKQLLYKAIAQVGTDWKDISRVLIHEYQVPSELMSYLNSEYLGTLSSMANNGKWSRKINA